MSLGVRVYGDVSRKVLTDEGSSNLNTSGTISWAGIPLEKATWTLAFVFLLILSMKAV